MSSPAFLTVQQIADRLGLSKPDTLFSAIHIGELRATNVGRPGCARPTWRVRESDLEIFLENRRAVPTASATPIRRTRRKRLETCTQYF
jgi:excisionase family DNA binding protein